MKANITSLVAWLALAYWAAAPRLTILEGFEDFLRGTPPPVEEESPYSEGLFVTFELELGEEWDLWGESAAVSASL